MIVSLKSCNAWWLSVYGRIPHSENFAILTGCRVGCVMSAPPREKFHDMQHYYSRVTKFFAMPVMLSTELPGSQDPRACPRVNFFMECSCTASHTKNLFRQDMQLQ